MQQQQYHLLNPCARTHMNHHPLRKKIWHRVHTPQLNLPGSAQGRHHRYHAACYRKFWPGPEGSWGVCAALVANSPPRSARTYHVASLLLFFFSMLICCAEVEVPMRFGDVVRDASVKSLYWRRNRVNANINSSLWLKIPSDATLEG
jgi:hypothetical protein